MSNLYTSTQVENLIQRYVDKGGQVNEIIPGTLGYGLTVLCGHGLKSIIITETYINEWSSGHKVRMYSKMPKKYEKMLAEMD